MPSATKAIAAPITRLLIDPPRGRLPGGHPSLHEGGSRALRASSPTDAEDLDGRVFRGVECVSASFSRCGQVNHQAKLSAILGARGRRTPPASDGAGKPQTRLAYLRH